MKKTLKHLLLAAILVLMFGLFGCGSTLTTNLTMSGNYAGTRNMDVSIGSDDFAEYVTGVDFATLATETAAITPECLTFSYDQSVDGLEYNFHFVLSFTSKDDYMTKVTSLAGEGCTSEYINSSAPFSNGVSFEENFSSEDLLQWFKDYLVEKAYVDSSDASYIFEYTDNYLTVDGETFDSYYDDMDVEEQTYVDIEEINIFTDIDPQTVKVARKIEVVFDKYTMEDHRDKITSYLTSVTPTGSAGEWQKFDDDYYEKYVLLIPACTPDEMTAAMQTFTGSEKSGVQLVIAGETIGTGGTVETPIVPETTDVETTEGGSLVDAWDQSVTGSISTETVDSEKYVQPFGFDSTIKETLDLTTFICDSWGEVKSNYYISAKNGQPTSMIYYEDGGDDYGWDYIDDNYPEYYYITGEWEPRYNVESEVNKYYVPTSTELNTVVKSEEKITRKFIFNFAEQFDEAIAGMIETNLENLFEGKENITFEVNNKKKAPNIVFKFEGSATEVDTICKEVFGSGSSSLSYYCQDKFALKQQYDFTETIDLGHIFDWDYTGNIDYEVKLPGKANEYGSSVYGGSSYNTDFNGKKVNYLASNSSYLSANITGAKTNVGFVFMIIGIVAVVLGGAAVAVIILIKNSKKNPKPQMPYGQPMAQPMGQPMGQPMAQPMGQPMGQPMAQPQAAPQQNSGVRPVVDLTPVASQPATPVQPEAPAAPVQPEAPAAQPEAPVQAAPAGKFCGTCGTMLSDGTVFCPNCGTKVQ